MNCEQVKAHLVDYLYGELSAEQADEVEEALEQCPDCAAELAELREVHELMSAVPRLDVPAQVHHNILRAARVAADEATKAKNRTTGINWSALFSPPALATALVLAMVVGVGVMLERQGRLPGDDAQTVTVESESPLAEAPPETTDTVVARAEPAAPEEDSTVEREEEPSQPLRGLRNLGGAGGRSESSADDVAEGLVEGELAPDGLDEAATPGAPARPLEVESRAGAEAGEVAASAAGDAERRPRGEASGPSQLADEPSLDLLAQQVAEEEESRTAGNVWQEESQGQAAPDETDEAERLAELELEEARERQSSQPSSLNRNRRARERDQTARRESSRSRDLDEDDDTALGDDGALASGETTDSRTRDRSSRSDNEIVDEPSADPFESGNAEPAEPANPADSIIVADASGPDDEPEPESVLDLEARYYEMAVDEDDYEQSEDFGELVESESPEPSEWTGEQVLSVIGEDEEGRATGGTADVPTEDGDTRGTVGDVMAAAPRATAPPQDPASGMGEGIGGGGDEGGSPSAGSGEEVAVATPAEGGEEDLDELYYRALSRYNDGSHRDAVVYFDQLLQNAPRTSNFFNLGNYYQGQAQISMGNYREAADNFAQIDDPAFEHYEESRLLLAQAYENSGELERAEQLYNELLRSPDVQTNMMADEGLERIERRRASQRQNAAPDRMMESVDDADFDEAEEAEPAGSMEKPAVGVEGY